MKWGFSVVCLLAIALGAGVGAAAGSSVTGHAVVADSPTQHGVQQPTRPIDRGPVGRFRIPNFGGTGTATAKAAGSVGHKTSDILFGPLLINSPFDGLLGGSSDEGGGGGGGGIFGGIGDMLGGSDSESGTETTSTPTSGRTTRQQTPRRTQGPGGKVVDGSNRGGSAGPGSQSGERSQSGIGGVIGGLVGGDGDSGSGGGGGFAEKVGLGGGSDGSRTPTPSARQKRARGTIETPQRNELTSYNVENYVHYYVNRKRSNVGLSKLRYDDNLSRIATYHTKDMVSRNYLAHTAPPNSTVADRYRKFQYDCQTSQENSRIATGEENIAKLRYGQLYTRDDGSRFRLDSPSKIAWVVVNEWLHKTESRRDLLAEHWSREGVGVWIADRNGDRYVYVTQNLC